jgi:hypothetical protein
MDRPAVLGDHTVARRFIAPLDACDTMQDIMETPRTATITMRVRNPLKKRPNGWYFSKSIYHGDKPEWRGPYTSEMSVTLMIAGASKENQEPPQTVIPTMTSRPEPHHRGEVRIFLRHGKPISTSASRPTSTARPSTSCSTTPKRRRPMS